MESSVIILDSDDEDCPVSEVKIKKVTNNVNSPIKRSAENDVEEADSPKSKIRRIQPTKIGNLHDPATKNSELNCNQEATNALDVKDTKENNETEEGDKINDDSAGPSNSKKESAQIAKNELTPQLERLIKACRKAESSEEMKQVIKTKLLKYYHSVHPDFVTSKNFLKTLKMATEGIEKEPHLVYVKLNEILQELDIRRKSKATVFTNEDSVSVKGTGDETKDAHLKQLYRALVRCKRQILDLDEAEVDWDDDDNSSYLKKVRFEKRACEIYHKICEITGESTHAHRAVRQPIKFKGTDFPEFNKQLQRFVNKKNMFPNFRDVLKTLDYCNKKHNFGLSQDQLKRVAQDAFEKLGKLLQERRKRDLYETTTFYAGKTKDPAKEDPELRIQLEKNKKNYAKYDDIINEFAEKEYKSQSDDADEVSSTSKTEVVEETKILMKDTVANSQPDEDYNNVSIEKCNKNGATSIAVDDDDDDDLMIIS